MRNGRRAILACLVLSLVLCAPAHAAGTLNVFVGNNSVALGTGTQIAARAETDAAYGGGHVAFHYRPADQQCAPDPGTDGGADANAGQPATVAAGPGIADVGGQIVQLGVGSWRICGWLIDDGADSVTAQASTVVEVVPYVGSLKLSVTRDGSGFQVVLTWATSAPARVYASVQSARRQCADSPARLPERSVLLLPGDGRYVGSDGGLGRSLAAARLGPGRWRICTWLRSDNGSAGPASKTLGVPRQPRRGDRAGG
jgi:hypothetical protein